LIFIACKAYPKSQICKASLLVLQKGYLVGNQTFWSFSNAKKSIILNRPEGLSNQRLIHLVIDGLQAEIQQVVY